MKKKQFKTRDDDLTLDTDIEESDDAEERVARRAQFAGALARARQMPGFKESVLGACDAARSAAAVAILKYIHDAHELQHEWDESFLAAEGHYYRWALREAACKKFLRTIHKRFPFSELEFAKVDIEGDES